MMMGGTKHDWRTQNDLLIKFNNIQLRALIILLEAEILKREDMCNKQACLQKLVGMKREYDKW